MSTIQVVGNDGEIVKVNNDKKKFWPRTEATKKRQHEFEGGEIGGVMFAPGFYLFPFWLWPLAEPAVDATVEPEVVPDDSSEEREGDTPNSAPEEEVGTTYETPVADGLSDHDAGEFYDNSPSSDVGSSFDTGSFNGGSDGGFSGGGGD